MTSLLLTGIGLLVTNDPALGDGILGAIPDAELLFSDGGVAATGRRGELRPDGDVEVVDVGGRCVVPGFVDAHTHLVFAGDRAAELGRRLAGDTYEAILASGGGIHSTVSATRAASDDELMRQSAGRARRMLSMGTTTVEVKSGYGLDPATERRILEVASRLPDETGIDVATTFLAHVVPPEWAGDRRGYIDLLVGEALPRCAPLASFVDVFCDRGAFTVDEARIILQAGGRLGLRPRVHAEQLAHTGAAALGAELGAISADHLDHVTPADVEALRRAGTVAVLLPGAALQMQTPPPPARALWDAGVPVAVATDCNPGTSRIESMPFTVAMAALLLGLSIEEALWAGTRGGALALGMDGAGRLGEGAMGDAVVLDAAHPIELAYRPDAQLVWRVVKRGRPMGPGPAG